MAEMDYNYNMSSDMPTEKEQWTPPATTVVMQPQAFEPVHFSAPAGLQGHILPLNGPNGPQQQFNPTLPYQIIYMKEPERSLQHYPVRQSLALGVLQIICGAACIILGGCSIGNRAALYFVGHGIWGGICPIIAGALGIASALQKSRGMIAGHLVMSIIAASFIAAPFCLAISSTAIDSSGTSYYYGGYYEDSYYPSYSYNYLSSSHLRRSSPSPSRLATDGLLIIFTGVEVILAIWSSGIACQFCCCCRCCWRCCCSCYNKEGAAVHDIRVQGMGMQFQGQPRVMHYPVQAGIVQLVPPSTSASVPPYTSPAGYSANVIGYNSAQQPPSYSVTLGDSVRDWGCRLSHAIGLGRAGGSV